MALANLRVVWSGPLKVAADDGVGNDASFTEAIPFVLSRV
jgi:hypothetical protein